MDACPVCSGQFEWGCDPVTELIKFINCPACSENPDNYKQKKETELLNTMEKKRKREEAYKIETGELKL